MRIQRDRKSPVHFDVGIFSTWRYVEEVGVVVRLHVLLYICAQYAKSGSHYYLVGGVPMMSEIMIVLHILNI